MNKKWLLAILTTLVIAVLAACGSSEEEATTGDDAGEKKVLVMGTSADYAPFEFVDTAVSDEIIGYDIDLAKAIGEKLGYEIKVENMDFNSLIPALQSKKFDFVVSGMTPTEEREKVVDFSVPYYETEQYFVFKAEKGYTSPADLAGGIVGAQVSSIQEGLANEAAAENGFTVETRNLIPELVQELKTGRFDAAVIENIVSENYLAQNDDLAAFPIEVEEPDFKAVVFQKDSALKAEFDKAIEELEADGTLEELKAKWIVAE